LNVQVLVFSPALIACLSKVLSVVSSSLVLSHSWRRTYGKMSKMWKRSRAKKDLEDGWQA